MAMDLKQRLGMMSCIWHHRYNVHVGDHDSIYIFMQQNMSTFEYSSAGWRDIEVQA
jgi:hypothetical protein